MRAILLLLLFFAGTEAWTIPANLDYSAMDRNEFMKAPNWISFQKMIEQQKQEEQIEGMAYIWSGGIAFVGGIIGYHNSSDLFAKGVYALAQSLGVAAVGYGAYQRMVGSSDHTLYESLMADRGLTAQDRDRFVRIYFDLEKKRDRESQKVAAVTHGLLAALNTYNGSITSNEDLRSALYFIAAINLLASVSYSF